MPPAQHTPTVGVVGLPDVAAALSELGFRVVTDTTFRQAAIQIAAALREQPMKVVAATFDEVGFIPWVVSTRPKTSGVILLPTNPTVDISGVPAEVTVVDLPATVNQLLPLLGFAAVMHTAGDVTVAAPAAPATTGLLVPLAAPEPAPRDDVGSTPEPVAAPALFEMDDDDDDDNDDDVFDVVATPTPVLQPAMPQAVPETVVPQTHAPEPIVAPAPQAPAYTQPAPAPQAPAYTQPAVPTRLDEPDEADWLSHRAAPAPQPRREAGGQVAVSWAAKGGVSKALALDTKLPTPSGWATVRDVAVGDLLVGRDGAPTRITGAFDHEDIVLHDVHLSDGQVIRACEDHRWVVTGYYRRLNAEHPNKVKAQARWDAVTALAARIQRDAESTDHRTVVSADDLHAHLGHVREQAPGLLSKAMPAHLRGAVAEAGRGSIGNTYRLREALFAAAAYVRSLVAQERPGLAAQEEVLTTKELIERGLKVYPGGKPNTNWAIRLTAPLQMPDADLPVPPYTLGAWLGDGSTGGGGLTGIDPEVWERIEADGFEVTHHECPTSHGILRLTPGLRAAGVLHDKRIPTAYLRASRAQRLDLLRGLMDTDGTIATTGQCEFTNVNRRLADDVLELVRSLGIKATLRSKKSGYRDESGEYIQCRDAYNVGFTTTQQVFHLPRKAERVPQQTRKTQDWLYITDITPAGRGDGRCFTVDSDDHTFLCAEFVPTHNTTVALQLAQTAAIEGMRVVLVDGNRGQGTGVRTSLRLPQTAPTVIDALDGDPAAALIRPDDLNAMRPRACESIEFGVVLAPPRDQAHPDLANGHVYARVLDYARSQADLVIFDTQELEGHRTDIFDDCVIPAMRAGAWGVGLVTLDRTNATNMSWAFRELAAAGVSSAHQLLIASQWPDFTDDDERQLITQFGQYATFIGSTGFDQNVADAKFAGNILATSPAVEPAIRAVLLRITGNPRFAPRETKRGKGSLFGLFGGRK